MQQQPLLQQQPLEQQQQQQQQQQPLMQEQPRLTQHLFAVRGNYVVTSTAWPLDCSKVKQLFPNNQLVQTVILRPSGDNDSDDDKNDKVKVNRHHVEIPLLVTIHGCELHPEGMSGETEEHPGDFFSGWFDDVYRNVSWK